VYLRFPLGENFLNIRMTPIVMDRHGGLYSRNMLIPRSQLDRELGLGIFKIVDFFNCSYDPVASFSTCQDFLRLLRPRPRL
jgi:hypothetical protein